MFIYLVLICLSIDRIYAQAGSGKQKFFGVTTFDQCEGKEASNFSLVENWTRDQFCGPPPTNAGSDLIQVKAHGESHVNHIQILTGYLWPSGAQTRAEAIFIIASGPLQGKFIYCKLLFTPELYLKKCSSALGQSAVTTQLAELLIAERLDTNVLLSPNNAYEMFKKGATTYCRGKGVYQ